MALFAVCQKGRPRCGVKPQVRPARGLRVAHGLQRVEIGDVGDRAVRALLAVVAGRLTPALGRQPELLTKQRKENLGLLLPVTGKLLEPPQNLLAARLGPPARPDLRGVPL